MVGTNLTLKTINLKNQINKALADTIKQMADDAEQLIKEQHRTGGSPKFKDLSPASLKFNASSGGGDKEDVMRGCGNFCTWLFFSDKMQRDLSF